MLDSEELCWKVRLYYNITLSVFVCESYVAINDLVSDMFFDIVETYNNQKI